MIVQRLRVGLLESGNGINGRACAPLDRKRSRRQKKIPAISLRRLSAQFLQVAVVENGRPHSDNRTPMNGQFSAIDTGRHDIAGQIARQDGYVAAVEPWQA